MDEIHTNELGAMQSKLKTAFHLIDPVALRKLAEVHHYGAYEANNGKGYGADNWRGINAEEHLNHAMDHITNYLTLISELGFFNLQSRIEPRDKAVFKKASEELEHAFCRLSFAVAKHHRPMYMGSWHPKKEPE